MADSVTNRTLMDTPTHVAVHLTNVSDGTGESAVVKIDKSAIGVASDGAEAASLDIVAIRWSINGFTDVRLLWDHTTDDLAMVLTGSGYDDFTTPPPGENQLVRTGGLKDPRSTGATGDLLLTTTGAASGDTYDITIWCRKNPD